MMDAVLHPKHTAGKRGKVRKWMRMAEVGLANRQGT